MFSFSLLLFIQVSKIGNFIPKEYSILYENSDNQTMKAINTSLIAEGLSGQVYLYSTLSETIGDEDVKENIRVVKRFFKEKEHHYLAETAAYNHLN